LRRSDAWRAALVVGTVAVILAATTFPTPVTGGRSPDLCVVCGERGVADAIANLLLFAPFGVALAIWGWRGRRSVVAALTLSALIEGAQLLFIRGRDPSASDLFFNALGAALGFLLVARSRAWLIPTASQARALAWIWSVGIAMTIAGTGVLLAPAPTHLVYYGGWTLRLGHLAWYRGRVLDATLGVLPLPSWRIDDSEAARAAVRAGEPVHVRALAGPRPPGLAPVAMINDEAQHEIILLGIDRDDLVFRYRTRSTAMRLRQPDLRVPGIMRTITPGDTIMLRAWRERRGYCLQLDGDRRCGIGNTAGRAWSVVLYPEHLPQGMMRLLDAVWIVALFLPLGFWVRTPRGMLALIPGLVGLLAAPSWVGLLSTTTVETSAAMLGLIGGQLAARAIVSRGVRRAG
jgi:hypothetical protein